MCLIAVCILPNLNSKERIYYESSRAQFAPLGADRGGVLLPDYASSTKEIQSAPSDVGRFESRRLESFWRQVSKAA